MDHIIDKERSDRRGSTDGRIKARLLAIEPFHRLKATSLVVRSLVTRLMLVAAGSSLEEFISDTKGSAGAPSCYKTSDFLRI